jgi:hypothetical protein
MLPLLMKKKKMEKSIDQLIEKSIQRSREFSLLNAVKISRTLKKLNDFEINWVLDKYNSYLYYFGDDYVARYSAMKDYIDWLKKIPITIKR